MAPLLTLCLFMYCDSFFLFQANVFRAPITYQRTAYTLLMMLRCRRSPGNNGHMNKPTPQSQQLPPLPSPMNRCRKISRMRRKPSTEVLSMVYLQRRMLKSHRNTKNKRSLKKRLPGMTASCNCKVFDNS